MVVLQRVIDTVNFLRFHACVQPSLLLSYSLLGFLHIINEATLVKSSVCYGHGLSGGTLVLIFFFFNLFNRFKFHRVFPKLRDDVSC